MMKCKPGRKRLTLLVFLVLIVFTILVASIVGGGGFLYLMFRLGLMQPLTAGRFPMVLSFLLVVSVFISAIITTVAGNLSMRSMDRFIDTTKEVASGNFNVRFDTSGPAELSRFTTSLNEMVKELGGMETLRDDFVSNISHEFKTPVTSIKGFTKLLKKGNLTEEQRREYLDIILMEAERLTQLSSNVLLLSRLNTTDRLTEVAEYSLDDQLQRVILLLDQQLENKRLDIDADLQSCRITSNRELLQQVWLNLLGNAVKFTPEGGRITVALRCDRDTVTVSVADTGIGMEPEVQKRIFDKFFQGERSHTSEGNGLGLSLVRRILDLCGGTVEAASRPGEGSVFTVRMPKRAHTPEEVG